MKLQRLCLGLTSVLLFGSAAAQQIHNGEDLLRAMHDRYQSTWYQTLTFTQKSTTYNPDGTTKVETWHEAAMLPGKLRIDIGAPADLNGVLLVDGKVTAYRGGKVTRTGPLVNMLLVLGFDVYRQASEITSSIVQAEGYDLNILHEDILDGHAVYVVGADKGDLRSKQFWVEKDRLLFVRLIEPTHADPKKTQDIRFVDYRPLAGGWVAAKVEVTVDDKKVFSEEYSDIEGNVKLDPAVFDPDKFTSSHWEKP
jgi:outer membrane lipoprotein-sorting protein